MRKISIISLFLIMVFLGCASTSNSIDVSVYRNGWDFIGVNTNTRVPEGTYLATPFFTLLKDKGGSIIVLEIVGNETLYFDKLDPEEVQKLEIGTIYAPGSAIVPFPDEFCK